MTETPRLQDIAYAVTAPPLSGREGPAFCARTSGLYRSPGNDKAWENVYQSSSLAASPATLAVVLSPDFSQDRTLFAGIHGAVLRSVDGGSSWKVLPLPAPPPLIISLVISPAYSEEGVILAGTVEDGVFRSADRGEHWTAWNFGLLDLNILCLAISPDFSQDETLFAGVESGVFRSTNGGRAWREVDFPPENAPVISLALSPHYPEDGTLLAGTDANGLFISRDDGATWTRLAEDRVTDPVNALILSPGYPAQPDIVALVGTSLLVSRDGGLHWKEWEHKEVLPGEIHCLAAPNGIEPGARLLVGLDSGAQWI